MVKQHSLIGRILPNLLFTLLAFALYKYVTYLICPGFDRYGMIPTFQFIVMGTMGLLLGYTDYLSRMHQKKEAELHLLKIESLESRCTALTNQINPHFFFNSLSGISSLVRKKDERLTIDYIDHLSDVFRYILSSENKGLVTLEEELEFARSFCQVMQIRYAGKFDVCFDIPSEYMQMKIPVLALLPLIENVTVHNMIDSENRMQVRVYVNEEKSLVVENPIFVKQFKQETYGSGLQNLNKRFMLLANKQIDVSNDGKIFRVLLPLIPY
jgi:LytS/YehU family sensor histidine kinase